MVGVVSVGVQTEAAIWRWFCIHHVSCVNSRNGSAMMTAPYRLYLVLLLILILNLCQKVM